MPRLLALALTLSLHATALSASDASLRGSRAGMVEQNRVARSHGLSFLRTPQQIGVAVEEGALVALDGGEAYEVSPGVRHPYVVPAVRSFVEWLGAGYLEACGEPLVVTSAVRALSQQPGNAHDLSVHPAGMAVDLRVSGRSACREWLEGTLLELETLGVADGIRERSPPHYHVAVYPEPFLRHLGAWRDEARSEGVARAAQAPILASLRAARAAVGSGAPGGAAERGGGMPEPGRAMAFSFAAAALLGAAGASLLIRSQARGSQARGSRGFR